MTCSGRILALSFSPTPLIPHKPPVTDARFPQRGPKSTSRWRSMAVGPDSSSFATSTDSSSVDRNNAAGFCIIEGPETVQDFAQMQLQEIQDNIRSRRNKIFLHMEEVRRLRIQQRIKNAELGILNEKQENELPDFPSFIPFLPPLNPANLKQYYATCFSLIVGIIFFGGLLAPTLELKLGLGGTSYEDFIHSMHLPMQLSQVDPIVASFSGGAVGVISALMVVEVNNVKQQELKRCKYCLGTGYLACARCSSTGALVLTEPMATVSGGDQPLPLPRTERCSNCSGAGKVLISGKEEPDAEIPPAMDAVLRVFKRINGMSEGEGDGAASASTGMCSVRLLVASPQAINLIGKQGSLIKSIQENTGASMRVLTGDELPFYATSDERIVEIQGEHLKVLKALQASVGHLRKFLVDHSVIPLFEKAYSSAISQDRPTETWADKPQSGIPTSSQTGISSDYPLSFKRNHLFLDHETQLEPPIQHSALSLYGLDSATVGLRTSGIGRAAAAALVTQVTQTMQIPLSYAEDIIGVGGANIAYIRRTSGAFLTVQESRSLPDEITVEIKGTSTQVQTAQQLIQDFIAGHREPITSTYGKLDTGLRSYSQLTNTTYPSPSLATQSLGGYGSSGIGGGYGSYRH